MFSNPPSFVRRLAVQVEVTYKNYRLNHWVIEVGVLPGRQLDVPVLEIRTTGWLYTAQRT